MTALAFAGLGGLVGSIIRYQIGRWILDLSKDSTFPYANLTVNVVGCLLIGLLFGLAENREFLTPHLRALLVVGLLGGFTTFSTFGYETFNLIRIGLLPQAIANVGLQVTLGLAAVWSGFVATRLI